MKLNQSSGKNRRRPPNEDLLGRTFHAGKARITVLRVRPGNSRQVTIARDFDGKSWDLPAGLVRLILDRARVRQTMRRSHS